MSCLIDKGVIFDCDAVQQGGIKAEVLMINKDQWDDATIVVDTGASEEITSITLTNSGDQAYSFQTPKESNIIALTAFRDGSVPTVDKSIDLRVNTVEELDRINLLRLRYRKVVLIVKLEEGRSQVYGAKLGLRISDYQENPGDADTGGTIQVILSTPSDGPGEVVGSKIIASAFDVDTLLTPVP